MQTTRDEDSFTVNNQSDVLDTMDEVNNTMSLLLAGIAAISLLVGGIGIMNIMLVSVTERTREIGIRKAVGAKRQHIMLQFLCESCILSVLGGLIGLVLSAAVVSAYNTAAGKQCSHQLGHRYGDHRILRGDRYIVWQLSGRKGIASATN